MVRTISAIAGLTMLGWTSGPLAGTPPAGEAAKFVATVGQEVVSALAESRGKSEQRTRRFREIFDRVLDFDVIARRVLGRHWRRVSEEQRATYVKLFRDYVVSIYAVQLSAFKGDKFAVLRQLDSRPNESLVTARLMREFGAPLNLSFRVRRVDESFRIIDVTIAGISMIVTKRSEFDSIIRREGIKGLLRRLDRKSASAQQPAWNPAKLIAQVLGPPVRALFGGAIAAFQGAGQLIARAR